MPPKKNTKATASAGADDGNGAFRWTLENEKKLLILIQGRYLTGEDYERLVTAFPGTNLNGVKIKVSRFRVQQRDMYKDLGWDLPEGGAKRKTATGDGEMATPTKKPRTPKKGKKDVVEEEKSVGEEEDEGVNVNVNVNVKKEVLEDEDENEEEVVA